MDLASLVHPDLVLLGLEDHDQRSLLRRFAGRIAEVTRLDAEALLQGLVDREELGSTAIGNGVAIPHTRSDRLKSAVVAVGVAERGIEFGARDGLPVRLFFVVVSARSDPQQNLRCLSAIASWVKSDDNVADLLAAPDRETVLERLAAGVGS